MIKNLLFFFSFIAISLCSHAQICFGPNSPTTESNEVVTGSQGAWSTGNALTSNDVRDISPSMPTNGNFTDRLIITGFGFSLPANALISGITVNIERSVSGGAVIRDREIMLVKAGVTQTITNKAATTAWPTTDATATYGSTTDNWGNTLLGSDINDPGFGIAIAVERFVTAGGPQTARVDNVTISVCYLVTLPLQLNDFQTSYLPQTKTVTANWSTNNENNVKNLILEKSFDGNLFAPLAVLTPKGNGSGNTNYYQFQDRNLFKGNNYYRLKMMDNNGNYTYSAIRSVVVNHTEKLSLTYANKQLLLKVDDQPGQYYLQIITADGKKIADKTFIVNENRKLIEVPVQVENGTLIYVKFGSKNSSTTQTIVTH